MSLSITWAEFPIHPSICLSSNRDLFSIIPFSLFSHLCSAALSFSIPVLAPSLLLLFWYLSSPITSHLSHLLCPLFYSCLLDWSCNKRWLHSREIFHLNVQPVNKNVELTLWSLDIFFSPHQTEQSKTQQLSSGKPQSSALCQDTVQRFFRMGFAVITPSLPEQRLLLCYPHSRSLYFLPFHILQNALNDVFLPL